MLTHDFLLHLWQFSEVSNSWGVFALHLTLVWCLFFSWFLVLFFFYHHHHHVRLKPCFTSCRVQWLWRGKRRCAMLNSSPRSANWRRRANRPMSITATAVEREESWSCVTKKIARRPTISSASTWLNLHTVRAVRHFSSSCWLWEFHSNASWGDQYCHILDGLVTFRFPYH